MPIVWNATQIPNWSLLLRQGAGSRKERGRKRREGNGYPLCFCPFWTQRCSNLTKALFPMPKRIFKRKTSSRSNSRGADLIFFWWHHPWQRTSSALAGALRGAGPEGNKPVRRMEQLSWLRAIALGCLQAQADITTFSRYSSQFLGSGTMLLFF